MKCSLCNDTGVRPEIRSAPERDISAEKVLREGIPCVCPAALIFLGQAARFREQGDEPFPRGRA